MSVLIKNIKPPKDNTCSYCFFNNGASCRATPPDKTTERDKGYICRQFVYPEGVYSRPEWCPLVEVPGPHGRLIDADKMVQFLHHQECDSCKTPNSDECFACGEPFAEAVTDLQPTVIEAEKEK